MIYRLVLSAAIVLASSCASAPTPVSYAEVKEIYADQLAEQLPRIIFDFKEACNDEGDCMVKEKRIDDALGVITLLNDTVENLIKSSNAKVRALISCEYIGHRKDEIVALVKSDAARNQLFSMGKQLVLGVGCAALLGLGL